MEAVRNRAERWVFAGLERVKERLPFDSIGIDSDNVPATESPFVGKTAIPRCSRNAAPLDCQVW